MSLAYRLRVIRLVPLPTVSYGSDNYGDYTYGNRVTDTADLQKYTVVPTDKSAQDYPLIVRRDGDNDPLFECWLIAYTSEYEGVERSGVRLDLSTVAEAKMHIRRITGVALDDHQVFPMEIVGTDMLRCLLASVTGVYRVTINLMFDSGRMMTVPSNDSLTMVVN